MKVRIEKVKVHAVYDDSYGKDHLKRMESYADRNVCFVGIYAVAEVTYPCGQGSRRLETLQSSGLWGIESDSGADYIAEIVSEELADLEEHLKNFGIEVTDWTKIPKEGAGNSKYILNL